MVERNVELGGKSFGFSGMLIKENSFGNRRDAISDFRSDSGQAKMIARDKGGVAPSRWLEDERSRNLGFLVRRDLGLSVFQVLQVARKCFVIKEMKRGASSRDGFFLRWPNWGKLFLLLRREGEMVHYRDVGDPASISGFEISGGGRTWKRWRDSKKWFLAGFASRSMEKKFLVVTTLLAFLDLQVKVARCDKGKAIRKIPLASAVRKTSVNSVHGQGTRQGFYSSSCPRAESIVKSTVQSHVKSDPTLAAGLLRMHFHDCFVQGCDGSVLISGANTERTNFANLGLRGFEVIDDAKTQLETACPGVVSCADILALAARDSVVLSGGLSYQVPTGRRDGRVSQASDVNNLPAPFDSVDVQKQKFTAKGLNTQDLVTLLDTGSQTAFDLSYYNNLRRGRGILQSDQALWNDASTQKIVQGYLGLIRGLLGLKFNVEFGKSMVKMGNIELKTGTDGEIRKICSAIN
ncbi:Cationic peroxidase [Vigna angularis]|uniref:peroxidase n=1 Tax=Phaseolus angularis TaxID=3914 RepID=A0A8T0K905_PHAAN|nr:Cationic peroxidase [Vigna angularis]